MATMVGWLADTSCTGGAVCWLEKHPGSAAWLQGAGTIVALTVATGAYVRFYLEGFRPRTHARCNPDGGRALLTVSNVGRATGTVDYVLVGKGRRLRNGYTPVIYAQRKGEAPPCDLGATETMRLLLDADKQKFRFTDKSVRIAIVLGDKVKRTRVRPLRRGRKISAALFNVTPPAEATMEPKEQLAEATEEPKKELAEPDSAPIEEPAVPEADLDADLAWEGTRRELRELAELHRTGQISRLDLWIGRYRSLRRAQRAGPPARSSSPGP